MSDPAFALDQLRRALLLFDYIFVAGLSLATLIYLLCYVLRRTR